MYCPAFNGIGKSTYESWLVIGQLREGAAERTSASLVHSALQHSQDDPDFVQIA
jgi:hypothetical protein